MTNTLDLGDIQGNILQAYGRLGFPKGRFITLTVAEAAAGRRFVEAVRARVTTALRWPSRRHDVPKNAIVQTRPDVAINIAFTFGGLLALRLPTRTLRGLPDEFIDGMAARKAIIGDDVACNDPARWDPVWRRSSREAGGVHILVTLNAQMRPDGTPVEALDQATRWIEGLCASLEQKVAIVGGHRNDDPRWQDLSALMQPGASGAPEPSPREHFGFVDAITDPVFEGQYTAEETTRRVIGNGKIVSDQSWQPLATGEFLLGHPDEAQETAGAAMPLDFSANGTFMAYRKLHQNVASFRRAVDAAAEKYAAVMAIGDPVEARETLMAKMAGRWSNGVPLIVAPRYADYRAFNERWDAARRKDDAAALKAIDRALLDFKYREDPKGIACPFGAHVRRTNTRDMLDPRGASADPKDWNGSVLNNRRRILRRGLPYGTAAADAPDDAEHGIVMLALCASLFRQFEFVQQQWINYGLDANSGNDTCPLVGNRSGDAKFVVASEPGSGKPPFIMDRLPQFVETHGGDYFFVPSMTALRMIAMGVVDPT